MGYSNWSGDAADRMRATYDARTKMTPDEVDKVVFTSNTKRKIDPALDPRGVKFRESCDSVEHPESNAVAVFFDVTGSMGTIPRKFATEKLPTLMQLLVARGYIPHPQVLFGAIGDATTDTAPLQVGQFESGTEMDDCLTKIFLEEGGGGQNTESYELALYFAARHTKLDCLTKRGKKGYLFLMGDETAYPQVGSKQVEAIIGDKLEKGIPLKAIIAEVQDKYELFHICVRSSGYPDGSYTFWKELLGERALRLDDADHVCELIGMTIGACEGHDLDAVEADLVAHGMSAHATSSAKKALVPYAAVAGRGMVKGTVTGDLPAAGNAGAVKRL